MVYEESSMRKMHDTISQALANGIVIKGCYKHSLSGTHFDLYVLDAESFILGSHRFGVKGQRANAQDVLEHEVARITHALKLYKVDQLKEMPVQVAAIGYVLRVLYPKLRQSAAA
jgi:hypothetical protein